MKLLKIVCFSTLVSALFLSCGKDGEPGPEGPQGPSGLKSLLDIKSVPPGEHCVGGGVSINSGIDKNGNDKLDENEIDNTQYVCNGSNAQSDKQIIIPLIYPDGVGFYGNMPKKRVEILPEFNIESFPGVDSVVLVARVSAFGSNSQPINGTATLALFNFTDDSEIANSVITSIPGQTGLSTPATIQYSSNFFQNLPRKKIRLGVELGCATGTGYAKDMFLILYRK